MGEQLTEKAAHVVRWEFDHDTVVGTAVCLADPEAECRLQPASFDVCQCESWTVERDDQGWFHTAYDSSSEVDVQQRHDLEPSDDCNVCNWLNAEGGGWLSELADESVGRFTIAETPIEPVWRGDEGCDWRLSNRPGQADPS